VKCPIHTLGTFFDSGAPVSASFNQFVDGRTNEEKRHNINHGINVSCGSNYPDVRVG
jgi:hypothetical protein